MYRTTIRRTCRTTAKALRDIHRVSFGPATDAESETVTRPRGRSATDRLEVIDDPQCLQRMVANYLDDLLGLAEQRMPGAYLTGFRLGGYPATCLLPRTYRNKNGQRGPERRVDRSVPHGEQRGLS